MESDPYSGYQMVVYNFTYVDLCIEEIYISKGWRIFSGNCLATIPNQVIGSALPYCGGERYVGNVQWVATIPNQDIDSVTAPCGGRCTNLRNRTMLFTYR